MLSCASDLFALGYAAIDWDDVIATAMDAAERRDRANAEKCRESYARNIAARRASARVSAARRYREKAAAAGRAVGTTAKKLTPEQVAYLRASVESLTALAARFGVTKQAIDYHRKKAA